MPLGPSGLRDGLGRSGCPPRKAAAPVQPPTRLSAAVALYFMHYNFCRVHQTIKTTPAVASGLADHEWTIEELVGLLDSD